MRTKLGYIGFGLILKDQDLWRNLQVTLTDFQVYNNVRTCTYKNYRKKPFESCFKHFTKSIERELWKDNVSLKQPTFRSNLQNPVVSFMSRMFWYENLVLNLVLEIYFNRAFIVLTKEWFIQCAITFHVFYNTGNTGFSELSRWELRESNTSNVHPKRIRQK